MKSQHQHRLFRMKRSKGFVFLTMLLVVRIATSQSQDVYHHLKIESADDLREFFRYTPDRVPLLCGHRGGATEDLPENAIATFENTLRQIPAFFEIDPRLTKDSVVIVMHDATLNRTTNGTGKLSDYTWEELKKLRLKDPYGNITPYTISTLDEVLQWAKGKTVLMIDKKDVPLKMLLNEITEHKAESYVLVSSYEPEEAAFYHKHNKDIMFEAFITSLDRVQEYERTGVPWKNIVAYVSKTEDKALYDALHEREVMCINYTAPVLEKIEDKETRIAAYQRLITSGADILLADQIIEVAEAIAPFKPVKSRKEIFFTRQRIIE